MTEHPAVAEGLAVAGHAAAQRPVLWVVSGEATPEEIAAVVAAVAASTSAIVSSSGTSSSGASIADGGSGTRITSVWSAPGHAHRSVRATFAPGPDSWRTSFWPR